MPGRSSKDARRAIIGRYADWIKRFDVADYVGNPPLIQKLHEEKQLALVAVDELEEQLKAAEGNLQRLRLENQWLRDGVREATRRSSLGFGLSLLAVLLIGLGVNIATSNPQSWLGWLIIGFGCIAEVLAFVSKRRGRDARRD